MTIGSHRPHSVRGSQYLSGDDTQTLEDHDVLASDGSTGDAYDNSMAESFLDSLTTELIADRVWRTRSQLDPAVVEYIAWFNDSRLHENLDDRPPREIEELYAAKSRPTTPQNPGQVTVSMEHRAAHCAQERWWPGGPPVSCLSFSGSWSRLAASSAASWA